MISTHQHIANKIERQPGGRLLFPADFRGMGSEDSIKMSLSRHVKNGGLARLGHGIYIKQGRATIPSVEKIAAAIAKKERVKIRPTGAIASFKLGLVSEPPNELVYITDGEPRNIALGDKRLVFKATTPKKLKLSTGISGLLVQALEELGKNKITEELENKILDQLKHEKEQALMKDIQIAPAWIYDFLFKLNQKIIR